MSAENVEVGKQFSQNVLSNGGPEEIGVSVNGNRVNEVTSMDQLEKAEEKNVNSRNCSIINIQENIELCVKKELDDVKMDLIVEGTAFPGMKNCNVPNVVGVKSLNNSTVENTGIFEANFVASKFNDSGTLVSDNEGIVNKKIVESKIIVNESCDTEDEQITDEGLNTNRASLRQRKRRESIPEKPEVPVTPKPVIIKEKLPPVDRPIIWDEGDLVWSFVTGHPLWPCMVSVDPESGAHSKLMGGGLVSHRSYHVQFFGDSPEHAWVKESRVFKFSGKSDYEDLVRSIAKRTPKRPPKVEISSRFHNNWHAAIDEISVAIPMSNKNRLEKYIFKYVKNIPRKPSLEFDAIEKNEATKVNTPKSDKMLNKQSSSQKLIKSTPKHKVNKKDDTDSVVKKKKDAVEITSSSLKKNTPQVKKRPENPSKITNSKSDVVSCVMPLAQEDEAVKSYVCMYCQDIYFSVADMRNHCKEKHADGKKVSVKKQSKANTASRSASPKVVSPKIVRETLASDEPDMECDICGEKVANKRSLGQHKRFIHPSFVPGDIKLPEFNSVVDRTKNNMPQSIIAIPVTLNKPKCESPIPAVRIRSRSLAISQGKKGPICVLCEKNGDVISCTSHCHRSFHKECLGDFPFSDPFVCKECKNNTHLCIICKNTSISGDGLGELKRCTVALCGRFFHSTCLQIFKLKGLVDGGDKNNTGGPLTRCPSHACATCTSKALVDATRGVNVGPKSKVQNRTRMFKCVRCPTSYHVGDDCLAAGSVLLGGLSIICPEHFKPSKVLNHHHPVHISWCFVCSKGGKLICCATCPAAFHAECINLDKTPEGDWHCLDCSCGVRPLYDDIIWVKLGTYRWWPGQVTHPNDVPENISRLQHGPGEFVVRFFGSNDYFWLSKCRVFLYQEGDNGATNRHCSRGISGVFKKALQEAEESFGRVMATRQLQEEVKIAENDKKPAPYKHIKVNRPIGSVQIYSTPLSQMAKCVCKRNDSHPCGQDSECLNRMLMYECHPAVCAAGDRCENQRFQKCEYPPTEIFKTDWGGWGLKTKQFIKKGQFVNEYVGELVDEEECRRRIEQSHKDNVTNFYMLTIDKDRIIDAGPKGNFSRFMNHCCSPNCETQKWMVNGDTRVGLFALSDIMPGEELTFNYNLDCLGNDKTKCECGSENCSGFIGVRPKAQMDGIKRERKKKRRTRRLDSIPQHDDFCFRCRQTGTLVCCDFKGCLRAFCLDCLHIDKPPYGKWECPCHHCDWCGRRAQYFCSFCPNSFCGSHVHNQLTPSVPNKFDTCNDHDPEKAEFEMAQVVAMVNDLMNAPLEEDTSSEPSPADSPSVSLTDSHIDEVLPQTENEKNGSLPVGKKRKRKSTTGNTGKKNKKSDTD